MHAHRCCLHSPPCPGRRSGSSAPPAPCAACRASAGWFRAAAAGRSRSAPPAPVGVERWWRGRLCEGGLCEERAGCRVTAGRGTAWRMAGRPKAAPCYRGAERACHVLLPLLHVAARRHSCQHAGREEAALVSPEPPPLAHALERAVCRRHAGVSLLRLLPRVLDLLALTLQVCQDGSACGLPRRAGGGEAGSLPAACCWVSQGAGVRPAPRRGPCRASAWHMMRRTSAARRGQPLRMSTPTRPLLPPPAPTSVSCSCLRPCCMRSPVLLMRSVAVSRRSRCPAEVW